jgi:hypothetical protein
MGDSNQLLFKWFASAPGYWVDFQPFSESPRDGVASLSSHHPSLEFRFPRDSPIDLPTEGVAIAIALSPLCLYTNEVIF